MHLHDTKVHAMTTGSVAHDSMSHAMFCIDIMLFAQATESVCNKRIKCQSRSPWLIEMKDKIAIPLKAATQAEAGYMYLLMYGCLYHGKAYVTDTASM